MELNEIHSEHEEATTSLKVILLVFAVILVGVLAYFVWAQNTAPDTTDNSVTSSKKTTDTSGGTTATKKTTTPATSPCTDKSYTIPTEKLSVCYPSSWESSLTTSGEAFSFKLLTSAVGGSATYANVSVAVVKAATSSTHDYTSVGSFTLNGKTVYLMSPVGGTNDEGNRLSSCSSKLCDIAAKNTAGSFLEVKGFTSVMIDQSKTPLDNKTDTASKEAIDIIKSLYY